MLIINCLKAHDGADCSIIKLKSSLRYPYWRKLIQTSKRMLEQNYVGSLEDVIRDSSFILSDVYRYHLCYFNINFYKSTKQFSK